MNNDLSCTSDDVGFETIVECLPHVMGAVEKVNAAKRQALAPLQEGHAVKIEIIRGATDISTIEKLREIERSDLFYKTQVMEILECDKIEIAFYAVLKVLSSPAVRIMLNRLLSRQYRYTY